MKFIAAIVVCLTLTSCANAPSKRFEIYRDQVSANKRVDIVLDTLGLNDIEGKNPGFDVDKNKLFSQAYQDALVQELSDKGYSANILYATMGAHAQDKVEGLTIYYAEGPKHNSQKWEGPQLPEAEKGWAEQSLVDYFDTAFVESQFVNYKPGSKFNQIMNSPLGSSEAAIEARHARTPEAKLEREAILTQLPEVLNQSTADTILFVKASGYEVHRGKAALASVLIAGTSYNASGGASATIMSYNSTTPIEAVAIDKDTGQVVWVSNAQGGRYSESAVSIPALMSKYPKAGG